MKINEFISIICIRHSATFRRENSFGNIIRALLYTNTAPKFNTYSTCIICKGIFITIYFLFYIQLTWLYYYIRTYIWGSIHLLCVYKYIVLQISIYYSKLLYFVFSPSFFCLFWFIYSHYARTHFVVRTSCSIYVINLIFATPSTLVIETPRKHYDVP